MWTEYEVWIVVVSVAYLAIQRCFDAIVKG